MKKITAFTVAVLLIATLVFTLASCGDKNTTDGKYNFSAEVKSYELTVYNGEEAFQTLEYPNARKLEVDFEYAKKHIELVDLNFDGFSDVCLAIKKDGSAISYFCWLFNKDTEKFEYSEELSALKTISVNADKKQIISTVEENGKTQYICYAWENGALKKSESLESEDNRVPSDVSEAVKNNTLGEKENTVTPPKVTETKADDTTKKTEKETTTKAPVNNTTTSGGNTTTAAPETTKHDSTTSGGVEATGSVQLATGDFDDGWF